MCYIVVRRRKKVSWKSLFFEMTRPPTMLEKPTNFRNAFVPFPQPPTIIRIIATDYY